MANITINHKNYGHIVENIRNFFLPRRRNAGSESKYCENTKIMPLIIVTLDNDNSYFVRIMFVCLSQNTFDKQAEFDFFHVI